MAEGTNVRPIGGSVTLDGTPVSGIALMGSQLSMELVDNTPMFQFTDDLNANAALRTVTFDFMSSGRFFGAVSTQALDRASVGHGDRTTTFTINGGPNANQNPSLIMSRANVVFVHMDIDNAQNFSFVNRHGAVYYIRDFASLVDGGHYFEMATYFKLSELADASAPAGGIWWSTDNANVLKCKTPAGTLKTITLT